MLKKFVLVAALSFSTSAFASAIDGTWAFPIVKSGAFSFAAKMTLTDTHVTISNTCTQGTNTVSVSVTVPVEITDTKITSLGSAQDSASSKDLNCDVSVEPTSMDYVLVDPNTLTLSADGQKMNVTRVK